MAVSFELNGATLTVSEFDAAGNKRSLMDVLRDEGDALSVKDGCAPQGQCGCCTVLVDAKARVSCVTPVVRVRGKKIETLEGLPPEVSDAYTEAIAEAGASQCGFCTPGIVMRLEAHRRDERSPIGAERPDAHARSDDVVRADATDALKAHLCRCTGWEGIVESAVRLGSGTHGDPSTGPTTAEISATRERATLESGLLQRWVPEVPLGFGAFAIDTAPQGAAVAVLGLDGEWLLADSIGEARALSRKVQGRRSTASGQPPIELPPGQWAATLRTSWVEPAYLETDAAWCEPGGKPASVLANGGAFGAKVDSPLPAAAAELADRHGRAVLALWSREDVIRLGSKRPPMAMGVNPDGTGIARVARADGIAEAIASVAPGLIIEQVDLAGPPVSSRHRAAGWLEAYCALIAAGCDTPIGGSSGGWSEVHQPGGGWARCRVVAGEVGIDGNGVIEVEVGAGDPLDPVVIRSFVTGAVHMAAGLVARESITVDGGGDVQDLTIRSLGIIRASDMPEVRISIAAVQPAQKPVAVSDAVFVACAAAIWNHHGRPGVWPTLCRPLI